MNKSTNGSIFEDDYLSHETIPLLRKNLVVISGCSGGGKSTLLSELARRGFAVIPEPGRQIVKEQFAINGDALPWQNRLKFLELVLSRYLYIFNKEKERNQFVFLDRSIIDSVTMMHPQPEYFAHAAANFRYNPQVFIVPPWQEIFANDSERRQNFEAATAEYEELLIKYKKFGYEVNILPKVSVSERADFIVNKLQAPGILSENQAILQAKRLLEWNKQKLTRNSSLVIEDLKELFAEEFVVMANGRTYAANHQNYFQFLNTFRADIETIDYHVQEYLYSQMSVMMPLEAYVKRPSGIDDIFAAILLLKFAVTGKIVHWQEVYTKK